YEPGELRALRAELAEQAPNANRALGERRQRAARLLGGVGRGGSSPQREQSRAQLGSSGSVEEAERVVDLDGAAAGHPSASQARSVMPRIEVDERLAERGLEADRGARVGAKHGCRPGQR